MPTEPPPTRYKVVERGRRLEVIDTWAGAAPAAPRLPEPAPMARRTADPVAAPRPPALDSRGRRIIATRGWYDAKGPRRIALGDQGEDKLKNLWVFGVVAAFIGAVAAFLFWPLLLAIPFLAANPKIRAGFRRAGADFLDAVAQPETGSSAG